MGTDQLIRQVREAKRTLLTEVEAKDILKEAGIPVVETKLTRSKKEAISLAKEIGFPVGLKIASRDIVHKSDTGGVKLGLRNTAQISNAFNEICLAAKQAYPQANIEGVSVQRMAPPGVEVIIGMTKDPQFGPVLMFGLGGIFVEVLKDVSFRIVPVTRRDAKEMIREIKGYQLLEGYRGQEPANIPILEEMITKISDFVEENLWIKELDLNPIFAYRDSALVVDARIILESS